MSLCAPSVLSPSAHVFQIEKPLSPQACVRNQEEVGSAHRENDAHGKPPQNGLASREEREGSGEGPESD